MNASHFPCRYRRKTLIAGEETMCHETPVTEGLWPVITRIDRNGCHFGTKSSSFRRENRLSVNVSAPRKISSGHVRGLISTHPGPSAMT